MSSSYNVAMSEKIDPHENSKGLHWLMAVVFVLGDMVGGGMVVLSSALANAGLVPGLAMMFTCGAVTTYTGYQLSEMWRIMQIRWPKYTKFCRKPYGEMAYRACGPGMRTFLSVLLILTQFGFATVLLLLAAKNAAILLNFFFSVKVSFCYLIVIVGLIVWPATMLKSPMHFWQIAVFSAASSSIAVVLIVSGVVHDASVCAQHVNYPSFEPQKFFMAFGTFSFAFGGHAAFPTIQHDMRKPAQFSRSIFVSFFLIILYYSIVSVSGFLVYGNSLSDTVIPSIQLPWVQQTVNTMIAIHVVTTIVIVFSPMTQLFEDFFKIPHSFGWQRFVVRTAIFWSIVFLALSLPNFGPLMDLIGASTMTITSVILPSLFYLFITASDKKREEKIIMGELSAESDDVEMATFRDVFYYTSKPVLVASLFCIGFGLLGGTVATTASAMKLASSEVAAPCYVQYFHGGLPFNDLSAGSIQCCGAFHNITIKGHPSVMEHDPPRKRVSWHVDYTPLSLPNYLSREMTKKTDKVGDPEMASTNETSVNVNQKGYSWYLATVFLVGDLAGGGMIALPNAVNSAGILPGLLLLVMCGIIEAFTAHKLADNWCMMQIRWQKYRKNCRKPWGEMAYRASGPTMRKFVAAMVCIAQFGFAIVLLLLAAKNAAILLNFLFNIQINFCYLIGIVGFLVWPITMLKSPMHFWQVAVFSAISSSLAAILLVIGMLHDRAECTKNIEYGSFQMKRFLSSYGTMVFAFGGHGAFPTIHHDMRKPAQFSKSINICYSLVSFFYIMVTVFAHFTYGDSVGDSIISSIQSPWIQQSVNAMISVHVVTTIVIALSPMTQQIEELLKLSHKFGWQRFLNRSLIFWTCVFAALSMPSFGVVLEFIGSSIMSLICLILPCVFYLYIFASKLKRDDRIVKGEINADSPDEDRATWRDVLRYTPKKILFVNLFCIAFGVIGGLITTLSAGYTLFTTDVATPCYIQYIRQGGLSFSNGNGGINCCGRFNNVTVSGVSPAGYCVAPRL